MTVSINSFVSCETGQVIYKKGVECRAASGFHHLMKTRTVFSRT